MSTSVCDFREQAEADYRDLVFRLAAGESVSDVGSIVGLAGKSGGQLEADVALAEKRLAAAEVLERLDGERLRAACNQAVQQRIAAIESRRLRLAEAQSEFNRIRAELDAAVLAAEEKLSAVRSDQATAAEAMRLLETTADPALRDAVVKVQTSHLNKLSGLADDPTRESDITKAEEELRRARRALDTPPPVGTTAEQAEAGRGAEVARLETKLANLREHLSFKLNEKSIREQAIAEGDEVRRCALDPRCMKWSD